MPRRLGKIKRARRPGFVSALLLALSFALLGGCWPSSRSPDLPLTPILRIKSRWAVVKVSYARMKDEPSTTAKDVGYLREGTVVEVFAREFGQDVSEEERGHWLGVKTQEGSGWVFAGYLELFDRKEQALRASGAGK